MFLSVQVCDPPEIITESHNLNYTPLSFASTEWWKKSDVYDLFNFTIMDFYFHLMISSQHKDDWLKGESSS